MKQLSFKTSLIRLRISIISLILVIICFALFSFTVNKLTDDFFQQLGINKTKADEKITNGILGGYLDQYGLNNAKNIALNKRGEVVKDVINYAKQKLNSPEFIDQYNEMKENARPKKNIIQSPDELQKQMVEQYKKSIKEMEAAVEKADAANKKIFEDILASSREQLKDVEDPNSKTLEAYRSNYEISVSMNETNYKRQIEEWEAAYPANHQQFIKSRLQQFMNETANIDFDAQLINKNGKKYFVNKAYESKGDRWKMAYRAGREVVETARQMVQQWITELK